MILDRLILVPFTIILLGVPLCTQNLFQNLKQFYNFLKVQLNQNLIINLNREMFYIRNLKPQWQLLQCSGILLVNLCKLQANV